MSAIISIDKLYKTYYMGKQSVQVLKGLSLDIFKNDKYIYSASSCPIK